MKVCKDPKKKSNMFRRFKILVQVFLHLQLCKRLMILKLKYLFQLDNQITNKVQLINCFLPLPTASNQSNVDKFSENRQS